MKYQARYELVVIAEIEAESAEEAEELLYDNVPYPDVDGSVISADCSTARLLDCNEDD